MDVDLHHLLCSDNKWYDKTVLVFICHEFIILLPQLSSVASMLYAAWFLKLKIYCCSGYLDINTFLHYITYRYLGCCLSPDNLISSYIKSRYRHLKAILSFIENSGFRTGPKNYLKNTICFFYLYLRYGEIRNRSRWHRQTVFVNIKSFLRERLLCFFYTWQAN